MKNKIIVCSVVVALCGITMTGVAGEEDRVTMVHYKADGTVVRTSFDPSVRPCGSHRHNSCSSESAITVNHTRAASCETTHVWQAPPPAPVQQIVVQPVVVQQPVYVEQPVYYEEPRTVYWNGPGIVAGASFSVGYGGGYYGGGNYNSSYWQANNRCNERYNYRNTQHNYGVGGGHHGGRRH